MAVENGLDTGQIAVRLERRAVAGVAPRHAAKPGALQPDAPPAGLVEAHQEVVGDQGVQRLVEAAGGLPRRPAEQHPPGATSVAPMTAWVSQPAASGGSNGSPPGSETALAMA